MKIENKIFKTELIEWQKIKDLQPKNLKIPFNLEYLKNSLVKYGFSKAFDVWEDKKGDIFFIDGHTRTEVLLELLNDGFEIPEKLTCNFRECKDKKEAIKVLLEVHNQKTNRIDETSMIEWIDLEDVKIEEINIESINVQFEVAEEDVEHKENVKELTNMIACTLTDEESEIWQTTKEKIKKLKDKNAIFELIKLYSK